MLQDQQGFIWIGSQNGLVRYDGYQYRLYNRKTTSENPIADDDIRTMWMDDDGNIWLGTLSKGMSMLDPVTQAFTNYPVADDANPGIRDGWVRAIAGSAQGEVFIGTDFGLDVLGPDRTSVDALDHIQGCFASQDRIRIRSLFVDKAQQLWIGAQSGVCILDLANQPEAGFKGKMLAEFQGKQVQRFIQASTGEIWIGTRNHGAYKVDSTLDVNKVIYPSTIENTDAYWVPEIVEVNQSEIWLGTAGAGILVVEPNSMQVTEVITHDHAVASSIGMNDIGALMLDRSGLLWIGTWGDGIYRYNSYNDAFRSLRYSYSDPNSLTFEDVTSVLSLSNGNLLVGTRGHGIDVFHPELEKIKHIPENNEVLGNGHIAELAETSDGSIWIGNRLPGIVQLSADLETLTRFDASNGFADKEIISLRAEPGKGLYIGTDSGLCFWDQKTGTFKSFTERSDSPEPFLHVVWTLAIDQNQMLWMGTSQGLFLFNPRIGKIRRIDSLADNKLISDENIISLLVDANNQLWISTMAGLDILAGWEQGKPVFQSMSAQFGLGQHRMWGTLLQDQFGRIWTEDYLLDPVQQVAHMLFNNDGWDVGNKWHGSASQAQDGTLFYGGTEGLLIIDPSRFKPWRNIPKLVVTAFELDGVPQPIPTYDNIVLPPENRSLALQISALDFQEPASNQYQYRLLGFEDDWNSVSSLHRYASFTSLNPGDYTLEIRASNAAGYWIEPYTLQVTKQAAWYETLSFRLVALLAVFILVYLLFRNRLLSLQAQKSELDTLVAEKTHDLELAVKDKDRIMGVIAHDLKNKISVTTGYLDLLLMAGSSFKTEDYLDYIKQAHDASVKTADIVEDLRAFARLNRESDDIKTENVDLGRFVLSTVDSFKPRSLAKRVKLDWRQVSMNFIYPVNKLKFAQLLEHLLTNALKFSEAEGRVGLILTSDETGITLVVEDTGIGIPSDILPIVFDPFSAASRPGTANEKSTGLGLSIVKKLVEQHKGHIDIWSEPSVGTKVTIHLPVINTQ